jgi:epsilon-lactone hydrolase
MIESSPHDVLALLKEQTPDAKNPSLTQRQNYSDFLKEMQVDTLIPGDYLVERVALPDGVTGNWISLPEILADRVILFFHSGGFTLGSTEDHLGLCIRLARATRARVFSIDYRLSPEHPYPAPVEDAVNAFRYLNSKGIPPHRIMPVGISVGGNLVLSLLLSLRENQTPLPTAAVCMSPIVDFDFPGESVRKNEGLDWLSPARLQTLRTVYLTGRDPSDPLASPVHARLAGLPRLYIQMGTHELLLSDIGKFVDRARWAGVPVQADLWEGMFHCWQIFADDMPEAQEAIGHIGAFAQDMLAR